MSTLAACARCEVAIVGAGPVGLWLGARLAQCGVDVRVIERKPQRHSHSRAIGIHPPGLACLDLLGVAESLIARGVRVRRGLAYAQGRLLGSVSFAQLPAAHRFVLAVPQADTEELLESALLALAPGALLRGHELVRLSPGPASVRLELETPSGPASLEAQYAVGCDGKHSAVRRSAGIAYSGSVYRHCFLMGDVADDTPYAADAAILLTRSGLVESFPLPQGRRRWVASTGDALVAAEPDLLCRIVFERTGHRARADTLSMISAFRAEHFRAARMVEGRILLAGDAAHVLSPIGGQGMNLGWLDARGLAELLLSRLRAAGRTSASRYQRTRLRAARKAQLRSELYMAVGHAARLSRLRDAFIRSLLSPPLMPHSAELFAMRGL